MPQPASHEHKTTIDPVSGNIPRVGDCLGKFRFGFRRQNFVSIKNKNPFVAKLQVLKRPILFLRPGAIEFELHHFGAVLLGNRNRTIGALRNRPQKFRPPISRSRDSAADSPLHF